MIALPQGASSRIHPSVLQSKTSSQLSDAPPFSVFHELPAPFVCCLRKPFPRPPFLFFRAFLDCA